MLVYYVRYSSRTPNIECISEPRVGQRVTLFRERRPASRGPAVIGDAVVVAVRLDSATIRVQHATDVIAVGDSAAPQR